MDGIRNLFRKKLKGGGPSGEGGHRTIDPNNLPPRRKRGWENIQDHANEKRNVEARAYIADQKRQNAINEYYRNLAELRAETSITKQKMSNQAKAKADATKRFDVSTLKGPRR